MRKPAIKKPAIITQIVFTIIEMFFETLCTFTVFFLMWGVFGIEFPIYLILFVLIFVWVLNF